MYIHLYLYTLRFHLLTIDSVYGWIVFFDLSSWFVMSSAQEFNKKFRGSDDFKASVAEDKIESFGKVLQKFFDTEREDYKKDAAAKIPDYDYLVKKAGQAGTRWCSKMKAVVPQLFCFRWL